MARGARSPATALPAGSSRLPCGVSIPTRRSSKRTLTGSRTTAACPRERKCEQNSGLLAAQAHDHVDPGDFITLGRNGRLADDHVGCRNVEQLVLLLDEKVMVHRIIGVEISPRAVHRDLP